MNGRKWLAVAVIAVWVGQTVNLWPLPSDVFAQMAASADAAEAQAMAPYESTLWLSWTIRLLATPPGVASGILLLTNHRKWASILLVTTLAFLLFLRPWHWLFLYTPLLASVDRAVGRGSWLLGQPLLIFNTVVFPGILLIAAGYAAFELLRRRRDTHAI